MAVMSLLAKKVFVKRRRLHEVKYDIRILFNFVPLSEDERIVSKDILLDTTDGNIKMFDNNRIIRVNLVLRQFVIARRWGVFRTVLGGMVAVFYSRMWFEVQ
jgi:hypothetical protein